MKTNQHSSWLKHTIVCILAFFALSSNGFSQNLLTTSYAASSNWYTTASNCTLDTVMGSIASLLASNKTSYVSTAGRQGQSFGTGTAAGLSADGTSATDTTNMNAGKYFQFRLTPAGSAYSL